MGNKLEDNDLFIEKLSVNQKNKWLDEEDIGNLY